MKYLNKDKYGKFAQKAWTIGGIIWAIIAAPFKTAVWLWKNKQAIAKRTAITTGIVYSAFGIYVAGIGTATFKAGADSVADVLQDTVHVAQAEEKEGKAEETLRKIEAKKWAIIDKLEGCENLQVDNKNEHLLIINDNNSRGTLRGIDIYSLGVMKFKTDTVKMFVAMRDKRAISTPEAISIAIDRDSARALAYFAIFEAKLPKGEEAIDHWYNCNVKHGLSARIDLIKEVTN